MNKRATETTLIKTLVDSMSMEDFRQYVANDMKDLVDYVKTDQYNFIDKLSEFEVYEEIKYTLDEEMLEEFITTIKEQVK